VRLNSITLHGFKSFGNRTEIAFSAGTTVVVGPNGSGKSNVIEALRWATGGGRASQYRADDQTDLIFHGASGKRSVGQAEVEIELTSGSRRIHIQRTLSRDGTSRLRLNGRNARFLDLDEELSGSGLGRGSLAIISQGEISSVLMADPANLLHYLAEAAGVARLASRRTQALERLDTARDHLERLQDLHDELQRHLERLQREAATATLQQQLSAEELQLRYSLAVARQQTLARELHNLATQEQALQETLLQITGQRQQLQQNLQQQTAETAARQEDYRQASAATEAWNGALRLAENQQGNAREKLQLSSRQHAQLEADRQQLHQLQPRAATDGDPELLEQQVLLAEQQLNQASSKRAGLEAQFQRQQAETTALQQQFEREHFSQKAYQERREALGLQRAEIQERLNSERQQQAAALQETRQLSEQLAELTESEAQAETRVTQLRTQLEAAQQQHATASAEAQASNRTALQQRQLLETRQGYAQGPRNALVSRIPGILGSVADLLTIDGHYREALAAALGRRSEFIVTDTSATARLVLAHVRESGGFVTILPLDLVAAPQPQLAGAIRAAAGVLGLVLEHVTFEPAYTRLFNQLLGTTTIVSDMDDALRLAATHATRPRLVTLAGELLENYGALSGGRRQGQSGILSQKTDLAEAEARARELQQLGSAAERQLLELQDEARSQLAELQALRSAREETARQLARQREAAAAQEQLIRSRDNRLLELTEELRKLTPAEQSVSSSAVDDAQQRVTTLEHELLDARQQEDACRRASSAAAQARAVQLEQLRSFKLAQVRFEADLARKSEIEQRLADVQEQVTAAELQLAAATAQLQEVQQRRPTELAGVRQAFELASQRLTQLEQQLVSNEAQQRGNSEELARTRLGAARREAQLELASEELAALPAGIQQLQISERSCRARLEEVTQQLAGLGPVNHRAATELAVELQRAGQLAADLHDAQQASSELESILGQVDHEVTSRTEAAIGKVRAGFKRHVAELFGEEAQADISVQRSEERPVGLVIQLQPPGKRTRQLNLLSVGERTMGALAFLFALMDGSTQQRLPLAVLDEVDAPLDEANIVRFTRFVERLSAAGTQFILVSHQKTTFEAAEVMWGVTSDQGVSKLFSISRDTERLPA
jgi:chromosome segregation protein